MQRVGLHQHTLELDCLQQLARGLDLAIGVGGVGGLGNRHAQALGVEAHLSDECRGARVGLGDRTPQRLAITHQGARLLSHTRLGRHPVAQQGFKTGHVQLGQQQAERRVRWRLAEISAQERVERLAVPLGKTLHPHQRTLAAQDREDGHQQHPPLGKANAAAHPAIGQRLEKADQIACSSRRGGGLGGQGESSDPRAQHRRRNASASVLGQTSNRPCQRLPGQPLCGGAGVCGNTGCADDQLA